MANNKLTINGSLSESLDEYFTRRNINIMKEKAKKKNPPSKYEEFLERALKEDIEKLFLQLDDIIQTNLKLGCSLCSAPSHSLYGAPGHLQMRKDIRAHLIDSSPMTGLVGCHSCGKTHNLYKDRVKL